MKVRNLLIALVSVVLVFCAAAVIAAPAQTLTTLANFAGTNGANPQSTLIQGINGNIYGTTAQGGANCSGSGGCGTVFKVTTGGMLTTLHNFAGRPDGANPVAGLVQGSDGNFYGTTVGGGANNFGTVFKITPMGTLTVLHSFNTNDGANPRSALVQGTDGNFYGTTMNGGKGGGTVFRITPGGTLTTLYSFCSLTDCADGYSSQAGLVQGSDGNFYGTTSQGGANGRGGTVFTVTSGGMQTTLYSFCSQTSCADGEAPYGVLAQAIDGNFYGTTAEGGGAGVGTVFEITPSGTLTSLHSFDFADGGSPEDGPVQASDGNLYGTTNIGGPNGGGTIFKITPSGTLTTLYTFCSKTSCADGSSSFAGLVQAFDGSFYGTTYGGGTGYGTAFKLSVGIVLSPVQFVPVTPCRLVDTRNPNGEFGGPSLQGGAPRFFVIPDNKDCNIPATAAAYSLNVAVVPHGPLGYLTIWPTGKNRPVVSTLNSLDGRIKANAAIVAVGVSAAVSVFASNTTDLVLDIDGYFAPVGVSTLAFYPLPPCRVADTRKSTGFSMGLGAPHLSGGTPRDFPILNAINNTTPCNIPDTAQAYSLNLSAVPYPSLGDPLGYLEVWPTGHLPLHPVSTLNNLTGTIVANAAIVAAGTDGDVTVKPSNDTDLVIDINGYFAPAGPGGLSLYPVAPCRVIDTRQLGPPFSGLLSPPVDVTDSACAPPSTAQAYVFNATAVPSVYLGYLTLWPDGEKNRPVVSTLNAIDGAITSNMAIVPNMDGETDVYASGITQLILDISSYFAP
jgi:uncharacterized repeat protein (TIGR03803 family)